MRGGWLAAYALGVVAAVLFLTVRHVEQERRTHAMRYCATLPSIRQFDVCMHDAGRARSTPAWVLTRYGLMERQPLPPNPVYKITVGNGPFPSVIGPPSTLQP